LSLVLHVVFFLALSLAIVLMSAFYSEPADGPALRSVPRRYAVFVGACSAVAAVMLVLEALFASVA
jgi:hypothetical protein